MSAGLNEILSRLIYYLSGSSRPNYNIKLKLKVIRAYQIQSRPLTYELNHKARVPPHKCYDYGFE